MDGEVKGETLWKGWLEDWKEGKRKIVIFSRRKERKRKRTRGGIAGGISWNFAES